MELSGSHVLVTGASRGIGAAMAREFASRGATLSVAARTASDLEAVAADVGGRAFVVDLTDRAEVDGLVGRVEAEAGPIDMLVNNAGIETSSFYHRIEAEMIRTVLNLNLDAPMILTRHVLDGMLARNRGHLLFTSSLAGTGGFPGLAAYCASKAGLTNFAATLAMELAGTGIGTTVVAPGPVDTPMWDQLEESADTIPVVKRLGRLQLISKATPARVAKVAADAVEKDKAYVGLPRRLALNHMLRNLPTRLTSAALTGVKVGPQPNR